MAAAIVIDAEEQIHFGEIGDADVAAAADLAFSAASVALAVVGGEAAVRFRGLYAAVLGFAVGGQIAARGHAVVAGFTFRVSHAFAVAFVAFGDARIFAFAAGIAGFAHAGLFLAGVVCIAVDLAGFGLGVVVVFAGVIVGTACDFTGLSRTFAFIEAFAVALFALSDARGI